MTQAVASPVRKSLAASVALLALTGLVGCGGGDELAPPIPVAMGAGMATVTLGGVDLGQTPLVTTGISESYDQNIQVIDEPAVFIGDPPQLVLANTPLAPDQPVPPGCPFLAVDDNTGFTYRTGQDYTVAFESGTFTATLRDVTDPSLGYNIPDGTAVTVSYCYRLPLFSVEVGISLATGDFVSLLFFNMSDGVSGMRNTNDIDTLPPVDGSFAFAFGAPTATDLTILNGQSYNLVDDPAQNDATIISADLSNRLNPCSEGRVVALVEQDQSGEEALLEVNFSDPDCP